VQWITGRCDTTSSASFGQISHTGWQKNVLLVFYASINAEFFVNKSTKFTVCTHADKGVYPRSLVASPLLAQEPVGAEEMKNGKGNSFSHPTIGKAGERCELAQRGPGRSLCEKRKKRILCF